MIRKKGELTMTTLNKRIDFSILISVVNANPNGDPLNSNLPRQTLDGYGLITDVAIKRKIRNILLANGESILVQADDFKKDDFTSIQDRVDAFKDLEMYIGKGKSKNSNSITDIKGYKKAVCQNWFDVRAFGNVFAWDGISVGVRGPVSIQLGKTIDPIIPESLKITRSTAGGRLKKGQSKGTDTMGDKHIVPFGLYRINGTIYPVLADDTGFSPEDAEKVKVAILHMFDYDASTARPAGSMVLENLYWWEHSSKTGSKAPQAVYNTLSIKSEKRNPTSIDDYVIKIEASPNIELNVYSPFA